MTLRILIGEDEEHIGKQYANAIRMAGHEVTLAKNGSDCLSEFRTGFRRTPYDVIVLDYKMPVKNGMEVAKEILNVNPDQRIIFVSGYGNALISELDDGTIKDKIDFLTKPVGLISLIAKIEQTDENEVLEKLRVSLKNN